MPTAIAQQSEQALRTNGQPRSPLGSLPGIDPSQLTVTRCTSLKTLPPSESLQFGKVTTDHMLLLTFSPETGWSAPVIKPYAPLQLDPASSIFHYTPALFEGMKAYLGPDGVPRLFRPDLNMKRMVQSADRVALPEFNGMALLSLIKQLILVDKRWIPQKEGYSLYIRPTLIGTRASLGVAASSHATLFVILSPTGPYFSTGFKPITLYAEYDTARSWPGGTGAYKLGINYTPTFKPQREAAKKGYQQILWLLGEDHHITEAGQMNFFVVVQRDDGDWDLVTPPLDGTILPGVTRDSALVLGASLTEHPALQEFSSAIPVKVHVHESIITMPQLVSFSASGRLLEAFGTGTAAVVAPVERIGYNGQDILFPVHEGGLGPVAGALYHALVAVQDGRTDFEGWSVPCE